MTHWRRLRQGLDQWRGCRQVVLEIATLCKASHYNKYASPLVNLAAEASGHTRHFFPPSFSLSFSLPYLFPTSPLPYPRPLPSFYSPDLPLCPAMGLEERGKLSSGSGADVQSSRQRNF